MYADLVCKGGGVKGTALVGALTCFEDNGYIWKRVAGTSAGSIVAALAAVGYSAKEITKIMFELDYNNFADKNKLQSIPLVGSIASLLYSKGLHSGNYIESFLNEKFEIKGKKYFGDLYEDNECKLKIIATDVTRHKLIVLPDDLIDYNIDPMDFLIAKAVRMSSSIPFYYNPIVLKKHNIPCFIVDGGLLSNFTIWLFDVSGIPRWPTFGLNLYDEEELESYSCSNLISYSLDVIETLLSTSEDVYFKDCDKIRIINIPTLSINSTNFNISSSEKESLYKSGYDSAKTFLSNWSFYDYIKKYRL